MSTAARFARREQGAIAPWFAIMMIPMFGFTFAAIKFSELSEQRLGMIDAMDASALALARQYDVLAIDSCEASTADMTDPTDPNRDDREKLERFAREFFVENYPGHTRVFADRELSRTFDPARDLAFTLTCDDITISANAFSDMGGVLGEYFGLRSLPLAVSSTITLFQQSKMEIALVLDVTGSMATEDVGSGTDGTANISRLEALVDAVEGMLDHEKIFGTDPNNERVRFSIVPFSSMVNVGAGYTSTVDGRTDRATDWMDGWSGAPASHYHGANFLHAYENGSIELGYPETGTGHDRQQGVPVVSDYNVEVDPDRKVNHFDLFRSIGDDGAAWKGCVEARPYPLDELAQPPGLSMSSTEYAIAMGRPAFVPQVGLADTAWDELPSVPAAYDPTTAANSRFVPYFSPDEPDCYNRARYCRDESNTQNDPDKDLAGRYLDQSGWQWRYYNDRWHFTYDARDEKLTPGTLYDDDIGLNRYQQLFIFDLEWMKKGYAETRDRARYRNLWLDAREQGEDLGWSGCSDVDTANGYDANLRAALIEFDIDGCADEEKFRHAYVGVHRSSSQKYVGRYENTNYSYWNPSDWNDPYRTPYVGPNTNCGAPIHPLTDDRSEIEGVLGSLVANGATNTAVGMAWGWRTLTHTAPFIEAVNPNTNEGRNWYKIAVLLTDGENVLWPDANHPRGGTLGLYGTPVENRLGLDDPSSNTAWTTELDHKTIRTCHRMRRDGIKVYTIGFAIASGSRAHDMLKACSGEDAYFSADNATQLHDRFQTIADQITELHISG